MTITIDEYAQELGDITGMLLQSLVNAEATQTSQNDDVINGVIHECDRMLRIYDPMREQMTSGSLPIDCPLFYMIYGHALYELWFEHYNSKSNKEIEELCLIIKLSLSKFKSAYKWSKRSEIFEFDENYFDDESLNTIVQSMIDDRSIIIDLLRLYSLYMIHYSLIHKSNHSDLNSWIKKKQEKIQRYADLLDNLAPEHNEILQEDYEFLLEFARQMLDTGELQNIIRSHLRKVYECFISINNKKHN